jgi:hypothetical protein
MPQKLLTSSYVNHTQLFTVLQLLRHSLGLVDVKKPSSSPMQEPDTKQSGSLAVAEPAEDNRANTATTAKFMLGFVMCRAKAEKVN